MQEVCFLADQSILLRRYENAKKKGDYDVEQQKRENAKHALERYMHYYQRWAENDKARLQVAPHCLFYAKAELPLSVKDTRLWSSSPAAAILVDC